MPTLIEIKTRARQAIHDRAAVPAFYYADVDDDTGVPIKVRWHNRIDTTGDLEGSYGAIIDGIDRLIFNVPDLEDEDQPGRPVILAYGGEVVIPGFLPGIDAFFSLDQLQPSDGPLEIIWTVARLKQRTA